MSGRIVDAKIEMVIDKDRLLAYVAADAKQITLETMSDAICKAFCGPRGLAQGLTPLQADIHRRQHVEIAKAIFDQLPD